VNPDPVDITVNGRRRAPVSRREAMQWVMGAIAASSMPAARGLASQAPPQSAPKEEGRNIPSQEAAAKVPDPNTNKGYGTDPKLVKSYKPGAFWPLTLTAKEKKTAKALADTIFPADPYGPAASEVGVVEMLDEWVSAPYPEQKNDRPLIVTGLDWTEQESAKRFNKRFSDITDAQRRAICDDVCFPGKAQPRFKGPARFFARFRSICAGAYYATPAGWKAIGYVGNVPLEKFEGPPEEVLQLLGLA
jgi:gluconate 2-dehydrogenase subunit 3-like protein